MEEGIKSKSNGSLQVADKEKKMTAKLIHSHGKLFMIDIKNFRI